MREVKNDGYRLIVRRAGSLVRLFTRRGFDRTNGYPAIAGAAAKLRAQAASLQLFLYEPLAKRLVLSGLGALVGASREALMLHFVALQRQIGGCRRTSP